MIKNKSFDKELKLNNVLIVGVGLIGGSFALALKNHGLCKNIVGIDNNNRNLNMAKELGVIDSSTDFSNILKIPTPDLIMIATPVAIIEDIFKKLTDNKFKDSIITDVGSTKQSVLDAAKSAFNVLPKNLVLGHPIAGKEHSGVLYADGDLFKGHKVIITPHEKVNKEAKDRLIKIWHSIGAKTNEMDVKTHDYILAATSHLPHIIAYTLMNTLADTKTKENIFPFAAGGLKSLTRTASSNPIMWKDICSKNSKEILLWIDKYQKSLDSIRVLIENNEDDKIESIFRSAKELRDNNLI